MPAVPTSASDRAPVATAAAPKPAATAGPRLVRPPSHVSGASKPTEESVEQAAPAPAASAAISYEERKRQESEARKVRKAQDARQKRIDDLESRIAEREQAIRDIEATMAAPGFYDNHEDAKPIIDKHQALMWEVGDLMHQWEELQRTDL
jgi:ATP-binding cassette subfamily F protein 3